MAVAMTKHVKNGYFSNWSGEKTGKEWNSTCSMPAPPWRCFLTGPGPWSVDAWCMDIMHAIFG